MVDIMVSDFMKGRYNLMKIFVGIDIAKLNHFAAAISSDGEILIEPFKFTNDADGFQVYHLHYTPIPHNRPLDFVSLSDVPLHHTPTAFY